MAQQKLKWLSNALDVATRWIRGTGDVIVEQRGYGRIYHVVNVADGRAAYDQIVWAHFPGAVCVLQNSIGQLALVKTSRAAPLKSDTSEMWDPFAIQLESHGRESWEFPRGNSKEGEDAFQTAKREAEEETRLPVNADRVLGYTNQNTAYNLFNTPVVLASTNDGVEGSEADSDSTEEIEELVFKSPIEILSMIRDGNIICGHTVAAFAIYISNFPESICRYPR